MADARADSLHGMLQRLSAGQFRVLLVDTDRLIGKGCERVISNPPMACEQGMRAGIKKPARRGRKPVRAVGTLSRRRVARRKDDPFGRGRKQRGYRRGQHAVVNRAIGQIDRLRRRRQDRPRFGKLCVLAFAGQRTVRGKGHDPRLCKGWIGVLIVAGLPSPNVARRISCAWR